MGGYYIYNQFSAVTLVDGQLVDLTNPANQPHLNVLQEFVMKRNFSLILTSDALHPLVLLCPIEMEMDSP